MLWYHIFTCRFRGSGWIRIRRWNGANQCNRDKHTTKHFGRWLFFSLLLIVFCAYLEWRKKEEYMNYNLQRNTGVAMVWIWRVKCSILIQTDVFGTGRIEDTKNQDKLTQKMAQMHRVYHQWKEKPINCVYSPNDKCVLAVSTWFEQKMFHKIYKFQAMTLSSFNEIHNFMIKIWLAQITIPTKIAISSRVERLKCKILFKDNWNDLQTKAIICERNQCKKNRSDLFERICVRLFPLPSVTQYFCFLSKIHFRFVCLLVIRSRINW